ncbi:hypothetical protein EFK50_01180 [Nocardioides marmoriginsengisoli]|uniref:Uncharacterized protein n=1 Tax=Nocardioides marmoriginsengisoli TaxID=661483 RepID=A0A3N0CSC4_9ACTN|nr:hypothetical protein [Nocardioides marmoriginsengisoli]RNL66269.1 hypothetical protein EFK50_01180 [Nocardioides marmoriginsengisoli]
MTAPTRTYSQLRTYQTRIAAMLADPDCTGDLLALGVSLLDYAVLKIVADETAPDPDPNIVKLPTRGNRKPKSTRKWSDYAERAWGPTRGNWKLKEVLRKDIRRYDAIRDAELTNPGRRCGAPMIRREGPCNQSGSIRGLMTDPTTGRKQWLAACRRHRDWFNDRVRANRDAIGQVEEITIPAANAGGVLARHIPEIDWEHTWKKLDPDWTPPPEGEGAPVEVLPRLRLILGGA